MRTYYTKRHAQQYNRIWRAFTEKTLAATLSLLNSTELEAAARQRSQPLRILDAACGTGLLLERLAHLFPQAELYGVDASQAMLEQAAQALRGYQYVQLAQAKLTDGETAGLAYEPAFFDLIFCMNTFHYFPSPQATLQGLARLLAPNGRMLLEDYMLRGLPFPWRAFEWAIKLCDPAHQRLYTFADAQAICQQAQVQIVRGQTFRIDLFCDGWALGVIP